MTVPGPTKVDTWHEKVSLISLTHDLLVMCVCVCQTGSNKRCLADGKYEEKGKFNSSYLLVEEGGECVSGVTHSIALCVCVCCHS